MKLILPILIGCMSLTCLSQNATLTFGRYTDCFHRGGICSISTGNSNKSNGTNPNATFVQNENSTTTLRVFRQMITNDDEEKLMGVSITDQNKNNFLFTQQDTLQLPLEISMLTAENPSKLKRYLAAKQYPTIITQFYIDILITENE